MKPRPAFPPATTGGSLQTVGFAATGSVINILFLGDPANTFGAGNWDFAIDNIAFNLNTVGGDNTDGTAWAHFLSSPLVSARWVCSGGVENGNALKEFVAHPVKAPANCLVLFIAHNVRLLPKADMSLCAANVCFRV